MTQADPIPRAAQARPAFLDHPTLDALVEVVVALGAELWIDRDRLRVIEALLAEKGVVTAEAIEQHRDTPEQRAARKAERDRFVAAVYAALGPKPDAARGPTPNYAAPEPEAS